MKVAVYRKYRNGKITKRPYAVYENVKSIKEAHRKFAKIACGYPESYIWVFQKENKENKTSKERHVDDIDITNALACNYRYDIEYEPKYSDELDESVYGGYYSRIHNINIKRGAVKAIVLNIVKKKTQDAIFAYCIDRLLRVHKTYDPSLWDYQLMGDYYGDTVKSIHLDHSSRREILQDLLHLNKLQGIEMIFFILEKEYGYVLESLRSMKKVSVEKIKINSLDISISSEHHYFRLQADIVNGYKDHLWPLGIVVTDGDHYRLIDGYHRLAAARQAKKKTREFILLSK